MKLSVIIPTCNRISELKNCLHSIIEQKELPYEILVIDNSSENLRLEVIKLINKLKLVTKIQLNYYLEKNRGVSFCRNTGINKSQGDILAFTDDDCIVDKNWCRNINTSIKKNPYSIIVGNYYGGKLENIYSYVQYYRIKRIFIDTIYRNRDSLYCNYIDTKNFALTRRLIKKYHLCFDTSSGFCKYSACEDLDFSNQARRKKIPFIFNHQISVKHKGLNSLKNLTKREFEKGRAFYLFKLKWSDYNLAKSRVAAVCEIISDNKFIRQNILSKFLILILFLFIGFTHKAGTYYEKFIGKYI